MSDSTSMKGITAEQQARELLERMGIDEAFSAGDLIELANLIARVNRMQAFAGRVADVLCGLGYRDDGSCPEALLMSEAKRLQDGK